MQNRYPMSFLLFGFLLSCIVPSARAQLDGKITFPSFYAYHAGDDTAWARVDFDDRHWQHLASDKFPVEDWHGIGWFRGTLIVDPTLWNKPLGLAVRHVGAVEIYLDGRLFYQLGTVGTSKEEEKAYIESFPHPLVISFPAPSGGHHERRESSRHLLAIRYSCIWYQSSFTMGTHPELNLEFGDVRAMNARLENLTKNVVTHQILLAGVFLAFALVHALLFFFYPQQRANLYFAALTGSLALTVYFWFQPYFIHDPMLHVVNFSLQFVWMTVTVLCFLRLTYSLVYSDRPKLFFVFLVAGVGLTTWYLFRPLVAQGFVILFWIVSFAEIIRALIITQINKRALQFEGSWIISVGLIPLSLTGVYWLLIMLDVAPEPWAFEDFPMPFYMMLLLMISMSVFLARNFARTNNNLEAQLAKVSTIEREVRQTRDVFRLFVPDAVLDRIAKQGLESIKLGGAEEGIATILFTDIRSFTSIAEKLSPHETLAFLNEFMRRMAPVIHQNGGFINQFVGDEIMAIFYLPEHESSAIETAIAMRKALNEHNRERIARGEPPIDIGVGVNTGKVIWGTIGSEVRMESAIIGDTVNLASRLQNLTKKYGVGVLVSESAFREIPDPERFCYREIDVVQVRGKNKPVVVYEIFDADPDPIVTQKKNCLSQYNRGLHFFHAEDWRQASLLFEACLEIFPNDPISRFYIERCRAQMTQNPADLAC